MVKCIRCDEETAEEYPSISDGFKLLTFDQEGGALAICRVCFDQVKDRNLWTRY